MSPIHKRPLCWVRRHSGEPFKARLPPNPPSKVKDGLLSGILERVSTISRDESTDTWRPIHDYEDHIRFLKLRGVPEEELDSIRKKHEEYYEKNPRPEPFTRPDLDVPVRNLASEVIVRMTPRADGNVDTRVMENPFKTFYNKNNTMDDYIRMYNMAGCSRDLIDHVRARFERVEQERAGSSEFMDRVMSKYQGKSSNKVKKSHIRSRFGKKYMVVPIKVDDPEEDSG